MSKVGAISQGPACEEDHLIVEVIGKDHPDGQRVVIYDAADAQEQTSLTGQLKKEAIEEQDFASTLHMWPWKGQPERNLWLEIDAEKGAPIRVPLMQGARRTFRRNALRQMNVIVPVVPMSILLGVDTFGLYPEHPVLTRPGYLYVFLQGKLWRELKISLDEGKTTYHDVRLDDYRNDDGTFREGPRSADGKGLTEIWLPAQFNDRRITDIEWAFAEFPLPAPRLNFLERNKSKRSLRCQKLDMNLMDRTFGNGHRPAKLTSCNPFPLHKIAEQRLRDPVLELQFDHPVEHLYDLTGQYPAKSLSSSKEVHSLHEDGKPGLLSWQQYPFTSTSLAVRSVRPETGAWRTLLEETVQRFRSEKSEQNSAGGTVSTAESRTSPTTQDWDAQPAQADALEDARRRKVCGLLVEDSIFRLRHLAIRCDAAQRLIELSMERAQLQKHHHSALLLSQIVLPAKHHLKRNPLAEATRYFSQQGKLDLARAVAENERKIARASLEAAQKSLIACLREAHHQEALGDMFCLDGIDYLGAFSLAKTIFSAIAYSAAELDKFRVHVWQSKDSPGKQLIRDIYRNPQHPLTHMLWPPEVPLAVLEMPYARPTTPEVNSGDGAFRPQELEQCGKLQNFDVEGCSTFESLLVAHAANDGAFRTLLDADPEQLEQIANTEPSLNVVLSFKSSGNTATGVLGALNDIVQAAEDAVEAAESEVTKEEAAVQAREAELRRHQDQLATREADVTSYEADLVTAQAQVDRQQAKVNLLHDHIETGRQVLAKREALDTHARAQLEADERRLRSEERTLQSEQTKLKIAEERLAQSQQRLEAAQQRKTALEAEIQETKTAFETARSRLFNHAKIRTVSVQSHGRRFQSLRTIDPDMWGQSFFIRRYKFDPERHFALGISDVLDGMAVRRYFGEYTERGPDEERVLGSTNRSRVNAEQATAGVVDRYLTVLPVNTETESLVRNANNAFRALQRVANQSNEGNQPLNTSNTTGAVGAADRAINNAEDGLRAAETGVQTVRTELELAEIRRNAAQRAVDEMAAAQAVLNERVERSRELANQAPIKHARTEQILTEAELRLAELNAKLSAAQQSVVAAESDVQRARSGFDKAQNELERAKTKLDQAKSTLSDARGSRAHQFLNTPALPIAVLGLEIWNLKSELSIWAETERKRSSSRARSGAFSAGYDLALALTSLTEKLTHNHRIGQRLAMVMEYKPLYASSFLSQKYPGIANKLLISRMLGGISGFWFAALSFSDTLFAFATGNDAAWGYLLMSAGGVGMGIGALLGAGAVFMGLNPVGWIILGLTLTLAGVGAVWWLNQTPLEEWIAQGPFGNHQVDESRFLRDDEIKSLHRLLNTLLGFRIQMSANPAFRQLSSLGHLSDEQLAKQGYEPSRRKEYQAMNEANTLIKVESNLSSLFAGIQSLNYHTKVQLKETISPYNNPEKKIRTVRIQTSALCQRLHNNCHEVYVTTPNNGLRVANNLYTPSGLELGTYSWAVRTQLSVNVMGSTLHFPSPSPGDPLDYQHAEHGTPDFKETSQLYWANEITSPSNEEEFRLRDQRIVYA